MAIEDHQIRGEVYRFKYSDSERFRKTSLMATSVFVIVSSGLAIVLGLMKWLSRKNKFAREQAELAKKDIENAKETRDPSDILDGFSQL
jgi:uncharacterized membrane protein YidH (DUF202 family)